MTIQDYKSTTISVDNATGHLTAVTCSFSSVDLQYTLTTNDVTTLCDDTDKARPSNNAWTMTLAGFVDTTTDAIFGPLMEVSTSITKTVSYYNGVKHYTGEAWPTNIQFGAQVKNIQTLSVTMMGDGALNQTSVSPS